MITNNDQTKQLPNEIKATFKVLKHLRKAGITKSFGFTCAYLFQLIFCLIFENKNWFRTLESKKSTDIPAKAAVYRFLNRSTYSWRRFLLFLSAHSIEKVSKLTNHGRIEVNRLNFLRVVLTTLLKKCAFTEAFAISIALPLVTEGKYGVSN